MHAGTVLDVRLPGSPAAGDLTRVCFLLAARLRSGAVAAVVCHAEALAGGLSSVEALARLSLVARRGGARFAVRGLGADLAALVELLGLREPLGLAEPIVLPEPPALTEPPAGTDGQVTR